MRRLGRSIVGFSVAAFAIAWSAMLVQAAPAVAPRVSASASAGTLYLLQSASGSLERKHGALQLSLRTPNDTVTTFEDRPGRLGSALGLTGFLNGWSRSFGRVPPNAAL